VSILRHDFRLGLRNFARQSSLSVMIVGMLALGIGGTTAIFSIFNGLFLQPLPVEEPGRLVDLDEEAPKWNLEFTAVAPPDYYAWREANSTFDSMAAYDDISGNLVTKSGVERVEGLLVTHNLLHVLRLKPVIGRGFLPEEDKPRGPRVAMVGHGLWHRLFGGRNDVLGQALQINGQAFSVIGVLPKETAAVGRSEIWTPLQVDPQDSGGWWLGAIGRLKPGVTVAQAHQDLIRIHKSRIDTRKVNEITSPKITPYRERQVGNVRTAVTVMLGSVAVVLLIACVNVAGLMLARGTARSREMGIRAALGASRGRIVRQLLVESMVLAVAGGVLGVLLGWLGTQGLVSFMPEGRIPAWASFGISFQFLMFSVFLTMTAAVLFGLWPAMDASRVNLQEALQDTTARSSSSAAKRRSLSVLVVGEVALAVVLLVAAGLLVEAFRKLQKVDPGFRADNVLTFRLSLPNARYPKPDQISTFYKSLLDKTRSIPGVRNVGASTAPPLGGHWGMFYEVEGAVSGPLAKEAQDPVILTRVVMPGYFETMGLRLGGGRWFNEQDGVSPGARAVIVNQTFAKRFWPGADPVGKRIRNRGWRPREGQPNDGGWSTVVGVAGDVKHYGLEEPVRPGVYFPMSQISRNDLAIVIRAAVDPLTMVGAARDAIRQLDAELPMYQVRTMAQRMDESLWLRRTYSWLLGVFSVVALVLAVGGIYGVISYSVGKRTREIGIRIALGAQQAQVLRQVLRQGLTLALAGLAGGLAAAFFTAHYLDRMLFGVSPRDPAIYAFVALALLGVAVLANLFPARRAATVNPMSALRTE
jgi:predicted permease